MKYKVIWNRGFCRGLDFGPCIIAQQESSCPNSPWCLIIIGVLGFQPGWWGWMTAFRYIGLTQPFILSRLLAFFASLEMGRNVLTSLYIVCVSWFPCGLACNCPSFTSLPLPTPVVFSQPTICLRVCLRDHLWDHWNEAWGSDMTVVAKVTGSFCCAA